jgi:hypothetical protein
VTTAKLNDASVTTAKLNDASVTTAKVNSTGATAGQALTYDGTNVVWGSPTADGFTGSLSGDVTGTQSATLIANGAVNSAKIADSSIVDADIDASAAIAYSKLNLTGSIVNADIDASAAIAYSKLNLTGSIVTGDITDGTIVDADIDASAAIAYSKLNLTNSIVTGDLVDNSVTNAKMADNSVNTAELVDDAVTNAKMANNSVNTTELVNDAVTSAKIADGDIATADLADNSVTAAKMNTLGATTSGQVLTYTGGATPVWTAPSAASLSGTVAITNGGTGATTAAAALNNLGVYSGSVALNVGDLSATINVTGISATSTIIVTYSDVNGAGLVMGYVTAQGGNSATVTLSGAVPAGASANLHYIVIP